MQAPRHSYLHRLSHSEFVNLIFFSFLSGRNIVMYHLTLKQWCDFFFFFWFGGFSCSGLGGLDGFVLVFFFTVGYSNTGTNFPVRLWSLCPWRYLKTQLDNVLGNLFEVILLEQEVLRRSLPTSGILWLLTGDLLVFFFQLGVFSSTERKISQARQGFIQRFEN